MRVWFLRSTSLSLALSILCLALSASNCTPKKASAVIGPAGGTVKSSDGKVVLEIPAGALSKEETITITKKAEVKGLRVLPLAYALAPDGLKFQKPAKIAVSFNSDALPGYEPLTYPALDLLTLSGGEVEFLQKVTLTEKEGTFTLQGEIAHFSDLMISLGPHEAILEGVVDRSKVDPGRVGQLTLKVGEFAPLRVVVRQKSRVVPKTQSLVTVTGFHINTQDFVGAPAKNIRILGITTRGQTASEPFHRTLGNTLILTDQDTKKRFPMAPKVLVECLKPGKASVFLNIELVEEIKVNGKIADITADSIDKSFISKFTQRRAATGGGDHFTVLIDCKEPTPPRVKPADQTLPDATKVQRTAKGDIAVLGKNGVALHDGKSLKRKTFVSPGSGVVMYLNSFDDDEDFDLSVVSDDEDPKTGALSPKATKTDGSTKKLELSKEILEKSYQIFRNICPKDSPAPCKSNQFVGIDKDGKASLLKLDPKTRKLSAQDLGLPQNLSALELGDDGKGQLFGLGVGRQGTVYAIEGDPTKGLKQTKVGDVKAGSHQLKCDLKSFHCSIANLTRNFVHFYLKNDSNPQPVETYSGKLRGISGSLDLRVKSDGSSTVLLRYENSVGQLEYDEKGKLRSSTFHPTGCTALQAAAFSPSGPGYVAACLLDGQSLLLGREFGQDPIKPAPELPPEKSDSQDAGPQDSAPTEPSNCSKYRFQEPGKSYPSWYAGTDEGAICKPMYDKVYGKNGKKITCTTDADCFNPCRYVCCRGSLLAEIVACKGGICTFEVSNKCGACASGIGFENCGLPYKP